MAQVTINSFSGKLEGIFKKSSIPNSPCVIIMHPHPLYGGNMHNKIVFLMEKIFLKHNFSTLRFNFRGVDGSDGEYGEGREEIIDASTCCDWMQEQDLEPSSFWIAGFSFGAYIAVQIMMRRIEIDNFVAVGIPANLFDISFIYPCPTNGIFIHGEKDTIAPFKEADKIIKKAMRTKGKTLECKLIKNAEHFFEGYEDEFTKVLDKYIKDQLNIKDQVRIKTSLKSKL